MTTARLGLTFGSNRVAALAATGKTEELKILVALFAGLAVDPHRLLYLVKKFLGNHRRMRPFVHLAAIPEMAVVERVGQNLLI